MANRGDVTFLFSDAIVEQWKHENIEQGQGRPFVFSDLAFETLLTMWELFRLLYHNTEGFERVEFKVMKLDMGIPNYTSLCKRAAKLGIQIKIVQNNGKIDIVDDTTGLKVFGEGEWKVKKHGWAKHWTWWKLHLVVDPNTREIMAEDLADNATDDAAQTPELLKLIPNKVGKIYGDGAYGKWKVYGSLGKHNIASVIPPRKGAKIKRHGKSKLPPLLRDEAIRGCRK